MKILSPVIESATLITLIGDKKKIHMPFLKHYHIACLPVYGVLSTIFNPNFRTLFHRTKLAGTLKSELPGVLNNVSLATRDCSSSSTFYPTSM
jgi:hypothetical protein